MGERVHRMLAAIAAIIAIGGFAAWRSLNASPSLKGAAQARPLPSPQLTQLMAFTVSQPDTTHPSAPIIPIVSVARDPFSDPSALRVADARVPERVAEPETRPAEAPWTVTATLMAGTRRAAVINDALIYLGDPIPGGGKLTSVEHDKVVVTDTKGASHTVAVKEGDD